VGFADDVKQLGAAGLGVLKNPGALWREIRLLASANPESYYEFLGDDVLEAQDQRFADGDKPLWLNLGYWKEAHSYPDACVAMARKLAEAGHLGPGDVVVDCGFGFGEQDILWAREHRVAKIIGLNVTRLHVEVAQKRVAARGLADRVDLRLGSATEMPIDAASADKVVALESAFHFDTREKFFDEAFRVLRPGGRIASADCVPWLGERPSGLVQRLGWRRWGIPPANMYDRDGYAEKLRTHGFVDVHIESIRHHVFPGMHKYAEQRKRGVAMDAARVELTPEDVERCLGVEVWARQGGLTDYIIASAVKPSADD
jgi:microcystin synthetase protein McyJ